MIYYKETMCEMTVNVTEGLDHLEQEYSDLNMTHRKISLILGNGIPRWVAVFVNPISGSRSATNFYDNIVRPMLDVANIDHDLHGKLLTFRTDSNILRRVYSHDRFEDIHRFPRGRRRWILHPAGECHVHTSRQEHDQSASVCHARRQWQWHSLCHQGQAAWIRHD